MSNLTPPQSFQDRIKTRIRDSIGELLTDDELKVIVERAMNEVFFKPMLVGESAWGKQSFESPFVYQLIKELLEPQVRLVVSSYMEQHNEEIKQVIADVVKAGIGQILVDAITSKFRWELQEFEQGIFNRLNGS